LVAEAVAAKTAQAEAAPALVAALRAGSKQAAQPVRTSSPDVHAAPAPARLTEERVVELEQRGRKGVPPAKALKPLQASFDRHDLRQYLRQYALYQLREPAAALYAAAAGLYERGSAAAKATAAASAKTGAAAAAYPGPVELAQRLRAVQEQARRRRVWWALAKSGSAVCQ
jgi:hypothetical protein